MATSPTPITPLPTPVPQRSDPANFAARGDALMTALPALVTETNAAGVVTYNNAVEASSAASTATSAAASASNASAVALGAANFKGIWADLTGAISKPASVKHQGRFWLLLNNLANIALSEPGVTADWTSLDSGQVTARISVDTDAVAGVFYVAETPGITLSYLPGEWMADDNTLGRNVSGGQCFIDWGTYTVCDDTPESPMKWPANGRYEATYDGSTFA